MIIDRMRNTQRWMCSIPRRIGSPFGAELLQRESSEQGHQQCLQDLALGERGHQGPWHDSKEEIDSSRTTLCLLVHLRR
jgi:hypothetical protein